MMKTLLLVLVGMIGLASAKADILRLRDGRMFTGEFLGATRDQIWFQSDSPAGLSAAVAYSTVEVESLTFGPVPKQSETAAPAPPARVPSKKAGECYTRGSRESQKTDPPPAQSFSGVASEVQ